MMFLEGLAFLVVVFVGYRGLQAARAVRKKQTPSACMNCPSCNGMGCRVEDDLWYYVAEQCPQCKGKGII